MIFLKLKASFEPAPVPNHKSEHMYKKPSFLLAFFFVFMIHSLIFSQTLSKYDGSIESWSAIQTTSGPQDFFAVRYQIPGGVTAPYTVLEIKFHNNESGTIWPQVMLTHAIGSNQPDLIFPISLFTNETPTVNRDIHTIAVNAVVNTLDDLFFVIKFPEGEIFAPPSGPGLGSDTSLDSGFMPGNLFSIDGVTFQEINIFNLGVEVTIDAGESPILFRVERATGDVFTDGSFMPGGADLAEHIKVSEPVEPGDVVELDPGKPQHYRKARGSSKLIAGIITTRPGFVLGNRPNKLDSVEMAAAKRDLKSEANRPMLALMGRVPVKATTENGAIKPGDLLTVSKKPGYAMLCTGAKKCEGAIIGKALEALDSGEGLIEVLVISH